MKASEALELTKKSYQAQQKILTRDFFLNLIYKEIENGAKRGMKSIKYKLNSKLDIIYAIKNSLEANRYIVEIDPHIFSYTLIICW